MGISKVSLRRARIYLFVFIALEVLFLLASVFSLYPKDFLAQNPTMRFSNSIFWTGALVCSAYLWVNPNMLTAKLVLDANGNKPKRKARYLFHLGNILLIAGIVYGYYH